MRDSALRCQSFIKDNSFRWLIVIAASAFICACSGGGGSSTGNTDPGQPPPTTSLTGTVTMNGSPVVGATVVAFNTNTNSTFATTTTDANGQYSFSGMGTSCTSCVSNFQFWVAKAGYAFYPQWTGNMTGNRSTYLWDSAPSNWYIASGTAITRAGYNGQFTNSSGGAGLIFTVFNLDSTPGNSVTGANFMAFDGSNPRVHLAATGQSTSYAVGDDASMHAGVAWPTVRFVDNNDGTVTDALTGLIWLKDAGCLAPNLWINAINEVNQLASGSCGLTDGSTAGQWRMPNMWELESMIDESAANPAITANNPFMNVGNGAYWTSTSYYGGLVGSSEAWAISMSDGRYINDNITNLKDSGSLGVWAVKGTSDGAVKLQATGFYVPYSSGDDGTVQAGVPLTFPRMRDNGDGTVVDTMTGLVWLKKADCINDTWVNAIAAVNTLTSGQCGLTDGSTAGQWRMPNRKELESLADRAQNNQADFFDTTWNSKSTTINSMNAVFTNFIQLQYYWTSSTNASDVTEAWTVFSCDYGVYDIPKVNTGYTLAVR